MATLDAVSQTQLTGRDKWSWWCTRVANAIDSSPRGTLVALAGMYVVIAATLSWFRLFWFDELVTLYLAKLGNLHSIWKALSNGADPNPPLTHLAVMWSTRLLGTGQITVRLPAMLAAFIGIVCLYEFMRRRVPATYAAAGVFVFITTRAMDYSCEARSYAFMLASSMASLLLYRAAVEGRHRILACAGLAAALAVGISSNYYGVLAFFPIAAGELVRNFSNRKLELRVWVALAAAAPSILLYMPLIRAGINRFAPYAWNKPDAGFMLFSYVWILDLVLYPAIALLWAGVAIYIYQRAKEGHVDPPVLPRHELVAVIVTMAFPLVGYLIAAGGAAMIAPRIVLAIAYGFSIAVAVTAFRLFRRNGVAALLIAFACFSLALGRNSQTLVDIMDEREALFNLRDRLPKDRPLAVSDSLLSLPLYYYSSDDVKRRMVFPWDIESIRKYKLEDSAEQNLNGGRSVFPVPLVSVEDLDTKYPNYAIVTTPDNWFLQTLMVDGVSVRRLPVDTGARHIAGFFPLCHSQPFLFETKTDDTHVGELTNLSRAGTGRLSARGFK